MTIYYLDFIHSPKVMSAKLGNIESQLDDRAIKIRILMSHCIDAEGKILSSEEVSLTYVIIFC